MAVAIVPMPTGPPSNLSMMTFRNLMVDLVQSVLTMLSDSRANWAISLWIRPVPFTSKSRTRRRRRWLYGECADYGVLSLVPLGCRRNRHLGCERFCARYLQAFRCRSTPSAHIYAKSRLSGGAVRSPLRVVAPMRVKGQSPAVYFVHLVPYLS